MKSSPRTPWTTLTARQLIREVPGRSEFRTIVLADPLYAFIHRTESVRSVARIVAPGAQAFGGGTGIELRFFEELDQAMELEVAGTKELAQIVVSGGALFVLCSFYLDPRSHLSGRRRSPFSAAQERFRMLWHERIWLSINLLPTSTWTDIVNFVEAADTEDLALLRHASPKSQIFTKTADILAKAFTSELPEVDSERLIRQVFPRRFHPVLRFLRDGTRPSTRDIQAVFEVAALLGPWPQGLDLAEVTDLLSTIPAA